MEVSDSIDSVKEKDTELDMAHRGDFVEELAMRSSHPNHKKYGKMKVVYESERILITLGPDYICFLITFVCFCIADFFLISFVNGAFDKFWIKVFNLAFSLTHLLSYLFVAVSNPGIVLQQNLPSEQTQYNDTQTTIRYCLKCKIRMMKNVRHCKRCDVCIRQMDHHCPWTSKCIGGGNLKRFYFFITITPFYIIYFMVMLMISSALVFQQSQVKAK